MGFSFNGVSSSTYGIIMKSKNRPVMPQMRQTYETVFGRDGTYDFSDGTVEDRIIEVECSFVSTTVANLRSNLRSIAGWLHEKDKKQLIFNDDTGVYYMARVANQIDFEQTATVGTFTIIFRCEPFAYSTTLSTSTTTHTAATISAAVSLTNSGTAAVFPVIKVTSATARTVTLSLANAATGQTITLTSVPISTSNLVIDCNTKQAYTVGTPNVNRLSLATGDFVSLAVGSNSTTFSVSGNAAGNTITLVVEWRSRFY